MAHPTDVERELLADRLAAGLQVIPYDERDIGDDVELSEAFAATRCREPLVERFLEDIEPLRFHEGEQHAVGDLGAETDSRRSHGSGDDLEGGISVNDALQRLAEPGCALSRIRDPVVVPFVHERFFPGQHLSNDFDVFAGPRQGAAVRDAVPAFDDLRARGTDAENEAAAGQIVECHRGHGSHGRGPRLHLHDAGTDPDA